MTEAQKLAEELGISLRAAQHRLKKNRPPPPPPSKQANVFRDLLVGQVYELVVCKGLPYETAARRIIEKYPPEFLDRASGDPRPVTSRLPSSLTATAIITARLTIRPPSRTFR